jgi:MPBQ/MSBQ methyltransferase
MVPSMASAPDPVERNYASAGLQERLLAAMRAAGLDPDHLTPDDIGPLEDFHTMGRPATDALADRVGDIDADTRVLDVGAGLGGPARRLAQRFGCRVTALDLTADYCRVAEDLTRRTGLDGLVTVVQGDALELPFPDGSFDLVWTQHVAMNIEDKPRLYRGMRRVLGPGGRLALYDVVEGDGERLEFPLPWAREPALSFLVAPDELRLLLDDAGFRVRVWDDVTAPFLAWIAERAGQPPPPLGTHLLADDMPERLANYLRNASAGRLRVLRAVLDVA